MTSQQVIFIVCLRLCVWFDLCYKMFIACWNFVGIYNSHKAIYLSGFRQKYLQSFMTFLTHNFDIRLCFSEAREKNGGSTCIMDTPPTRISPFFIQCTYFINLGFIFLRFYYCDELCKFSSQKCESKIAIRMLSIRWLISFDKCFHIQPAYEKRHHEDKKKCKIFINNKSSWRELMPPFLWSLIRF